MEAESSDDNDPKSYREHQMKVLEVIRFTFESQYSESSSSSSAAPAKKPQENPESELIMKKDDPHWPPFPSVKDLIGKCCKPFEMKFSASDVGLLINRLILQASVVQNHVATLFPIDEAALVEVGPPCPGIEVTIYDQDGNIYTGVGFFSRFNWNFFTNKHYELSGQGWRDFVNKHDLIFEELAESADSEEIFVVVIRVWMFLRVEDNRPGFLITVRPTRYKHQSLNRWISDW